MNHPLTDKMIEKILGEDFSDEIYETGHIAWIDEDYAEWITGGMRAAYDLGFKDGSQASEGAMDALRRTIEENSGAMKILADS